MNTKEDLKTIDALVLAAVKQGRDETCLLMKHLQEHLDEEVVKRHPMNQRYGHRAVYDYIVDASLRRLKRRKEVVFDKKKRCWTAQGVST